MKMDIQIPFIFVSLFSLASVVLIFIYKFGIKEKSYEEALAEQRQQTHILLGIKPRLKEKKTKKPPKKVQSVTKDKLTLQATEVVKEVIEQVELNQTNAESQKRPHVEFKDDAEDVPTKLINKKQPKKDKVRPILIHKERSENGVEKFNTSSVTSPANHFEELHPKDDFELFRTISGEDNTREETEKNICSSDTDSQKQVNKTQPDRDPQMIKEEAPSARPPTVNGVVPSTGKEKRKKKSELNALQQLAGDTNGPNMGILLNLVRKAELSRSEVQVLIDLLLNKQHEAPVTIDEWSEGKSDPVQKLKKQLAEKEKLLAEEQQAVINAQAKLKEIRSEHQNEKSTLLQKIRSMEEVIHAKQLEANRNHQQIQQLQAQIKEEVIKCHTLRDEYTAFQVQRMNQAEQSEVLIPQMQNDIQDLSSINNQLRMELSRYTEDNMTEKERNQALVAQLNSFQKELEQATDRNRQLEDTRVKMEHDVETILKQENERKAEISRLNSVIQQQNEEMRNMEHTLKQHFDDLQKHKDESNKIINELTSELRQAHEETTQMKITHMNGALQENKQHEVEILNLRNELASMKKQLSQTENQNEQELTTANSLNKRLEKEIEELKIGLNEEKLKLEEQKSKNNELRQRNWKVMEALNAAECRIKNCTPNIKTKCQQDIEREFIQRLFPEIKDEEIMDAELYKTEGETFIRKYLTNLGKENLKNENDSDTQQLRVQLQHYENVIDNTEKMLNKLQRHIEQEEIKWRTQLSAKTDELEMMKERHTQELHEKVSRLEIELKKEQEDKKRLIGEVQQCNSNGHTQNSSSAH